MRLVLAYISGLSYFLYIVLDSLIVITSFPTGTYVRLMSNYSASGRFEKSFY